MDEFGMLIGIIAVVYIIKRIFDNANNIHKTKEKLYIQFAEKYSITHVSRKKLLVILNSVFGKVNGKSFLLCEKLDNIKDRAVTTELTFPTTIPTNFIIEKKGFFSLKSNIENLQPILIQNEDFKSSYLLKSDNPEETLKIINEEIISELIEMSTFFYGILVVHNGKLTYTFKGGLNNESGWRNFEQILALFLLMDQTKNS